MLTRIRERLRIILGRITVQDAQQSTSLSEDELGENTGTLKQKLEERRMTAPDGQVLPNWMSYVTYVSVIDGVSITTGSVADLPLTYYGASIPLISGWIYGGSTRPTSHISISASESLSESISEEQTTQVINVMSSSNSDSRTSSSDTRSQSSSTSTLFSSSLVPPTSSILPSGSIMSTSKSTSPPKASDAQPTTTCTSTSTSSFVPNNQHNIVPPLLAVLIPVGIAFLIFLLLFCVYRCKRSDLGKGSLSWLFKPRQCTPVPCTPRKRRTPPIMTANPCFRSPNEKSALLPDFVAQHHRKSSNVSASMEKDAGIRELVQQNQSLLQRLSIGLGWANQTSNNSGKSGTSRRTSGNTLEKGLGAGEAVAMAASRAAGAAGAVGIGWTMTGSNSNGNGQKYERVLNDDQLFYKVPWQTHSSNGSRGGASPSSSSLSRPSATASKQINSQASVREEVANPRHEGRPSMTFSVSIPETPGSRHLSESDMEAADFSIRMASQPHISKDRMRFPIPPGLGLYKDGAVSSNEDREGIPRTPTDSRGTSSGTFYSANSALHRDFTPPPGSPLHRDASDYKHASVSAFGSHPATPTIAFHDHTTMSSQSHCSPFSTNSCRSPITRVAASRDPSPLKLPASPSPVGSRMVPNSVATDSAIQPMKKLFAPTPQSSRGSRSEMGVEDEREEEYTGQPIIDEASLRGGMVIRRNIGEFGESLRPAYVFQNIISPTYTSLAPSYSSETASIHTSHFGSSFSDPPSHQSHQSQAPSQCESSLSSRGLHASVNAASRRQALRGRMSHAQLFRTSEIVEQLEEMPSMSREQQIGVGAVGQGDEEEEGGDIGESSSLVGFESGNQT
ncbi:hypothetical protein I315_01875 [Cryptococcus gattii Ru294]|nr:hypothetical protein I315_01875 [Cryptococcus gattii Ru294]